MKVVFHVNTIESYERAQGNLKNILMFEDIKEVILLINGSAINIVTEPINFIPGIKYEVCNNSLKSNNIDPTSLDSNYHVVPAGVYRLVELQHAQYAYIKP